MRDPESESTVYRRFSFTGAGDWSRCVRSALGIQTDRIGRVGAAPKFSVYRGRDGMWWATWDPERSVPEELARRIRARLPKSPLVPREELDARLAPYPRSAR